MREGGREGRREGGREGERERERAHLEKYYSRTGKKSFESVPRRYKKQWGTDSKDFTLENTFSDVANTLKFAKVFICECFWLYTVCCLCELCILVFQT